MQNYNKACVKLSELELLIFPIKLYMQKFILIKIKWLNKPCKFNFTFHTKTNFSCIHVHNIASPTRLRTSRKYYHHSSLLQCSTIQSAIISYFSLFYQLYRTLL